ncbi:hypothetical protein WN943_007734 [Citrus x changshan-huyou]
MPVQDYRYLDVIVARVPCRGDGDGGGGMRDVFRLQVNLVVANLAVESGLVKPDVDRAVYVVFVGSCGAMVSSYNGGDQGFLNEVFTWWHRLPKRINHLKVFSKQDDKEHQVGDGLYAIHYLGLKPWMCYKDYDCNWDMVSRHIFASD